MLTIEPDPAGSSKAPFPRIGDRLAPVDVRRADGGVTRVYHTQVGDRVTTHLYESSSDVPLASRGDKTLAVPPEGAAWTWHVTGSEPGPRPLEFEMLADYVHEATPGHWPLGMMSIELPVDPAHRPGVILNMQRIAEMAVLVMSFPLPDDAEPAPVFRA